MNDAAQIVRRKKHADEERKKLDALDEGVFKNKLLVLLAAETRREVRSDYRRMNALLSRNAEGYRQFVENREERWQRHGSELEEELKALGMNEGHVSETVQQFAGKAAYGTDLVVDAVKAGIEFILYATRCCVDDGMLLNYYMTNNQGKAMVARMKQGFLDTGQEDMAERLDLGVDTLDTIAGCMGYESRNELVRNTGMSMAQSIVFCASNYNPMLQTKLMAVAVMSIMGLKDKIGDVSPKTTELMYKSFLMG